MSVTGRLLSEGSRPATEPVAGIPIGAPVNAGLEVHLPSRLAVSIRTVTHQDEPAIFDFLSGLSIDSRRLRFFSTAVDLRAEARQGAAGDSDHHGVVAITHERRIVGHAIYVRAPGSDRAEVAVEVVDDLHRMGLATMLLIRLARFAEGSQITHFFAEVLPENRDMLTIFRDGFGAQSVIRRDEVDVEFATSRWHRAHAGLKR
jgi:acetate---CoA ligase (ADP-forming)